MAQTAGKEEDVGKTTSIGVVPESSWDATLSSFLQQKGKGSAGKGIIGKLGIGVCLSYSETEGKGKEQGHAERDESIFLNQAEVVAVPGIFPDAQTVGRRANSIFDAKVAPTFFVQPRSVLLGLLSDLVGSPTTHPCLVQDTESYGEGFGQ